MNDCYQSGLYRSISQIFLKNMGSPMCDSAQRIINRMFNLESS